MTAARTLSRALPRALLCSLATALLLPALAPADPPAPVEPLVPLIAAPAPGSSVDSQLPVFSGSTGDLEDAIAIELFSGEAAEGVPLQTLAAQLDAVSGEWTASTALALEPGAYTALAVQTPAGGTSLQSAPVTFTVDTTAPAVGIAAPPELGDDPTPRFEGPAGVEAGDEAVAVSVHRGSSAAGPLAAEGLATVAGESWSWVSPHLKDGIYTAQASQRDAAGNVGLSAAVTFSIDTVAPKVTLTNPTFGSVLYEPRPTFAGAAGEGAGDERTVTLRLYADGPDRTETLLATIEGLAVRSGFWSSAGRGPDLEDGLYTAVAEQRDAAGNAGLSEAIAFLVASAPAPAPSLTGTGSTTPASTVAPSVLAPVTAARSGATMMQPFPVVRIVGSDTVAGARLSLLSVQAPVGARILVSCHGGGCPARRLSVIAGAGSHRPAGASAIVSFRRFQRSLRAGVTLEIRVTGNGQIGKYTRFTIRRGALPLRYDSCLDALGQKPILCPS